MKIAIGFGRKPGYQALRAAIGEICFNDMPNEVDGEIGGSRGGGCHVWVRRGHGLLKP
jgi:hypothetical protein